MKLLVTSLGVLALALFSCAKAQDATSSFFGFHYEFVKPNSFTPLAVNVTQTPDGLHYRSIQETFGANNEIGLKPESGLRESDIIWVKDGLDWLQIFYNTQEIEAFGMTKGWRARGRANTDMGGYIIPLNTGFFIQSKKDFEWYVAYGGYVRQQPMVYEVTNGFNILNRGYPTPIRLDESGIERSEGFKKGDSASGDIIWLYRSNQNESGYYERYYYTEGIAPFLSEGWKKIGEGDVDAAEDTITNTFLIQTRGDGGRIVLYPPVGFVKKQTQPLNNIAPPKPNVYTFISVDNFGNPFFNIAWQADNANIHYATEVWDYNVNFLIDPFGEWWTLNTKWGDAGQVLSNGASILGFYNPRSGIGRVVATWATPPEKPKG